MIESIIYYCYAIFLHPTSNPKLLLCLVNWQKCCLGLKLHVQIHKIFVSKHLQLYSIIGNQRIE